ncbi:M15 family metallopeptidase, partial [Cellulomonas triticagri]
SDLLPEAGHGLGADLVGPGPARATPGLLRGDGTVDPATLCPVPFAPGALLRCDAVEALVALNEVFRADHGEDLPVGGTYRSYAEQVRLRAAKGGLAAPPGTSHHGWGVAVDFEGFGGVGQFDTPLFRWMVEHAPAYGWVHPAELGPGGGGPQEPWHWEFAGTEPQTGR